MSGRAMLVLTGPIAAGKSTVAAAVATRLRAAGREVAVLDFDDVVQTVGGFKGITHARAAAALRVFAELVGAWLREGADVMAHGPFFAADEHSAIVGRVPE